MCLQKLEALFFYSQNNWNLKNSSGVLIIKSSYPTKENLPMNIITRLICTVLLLSVATGCASALADSCPVTGPLWIKPPEDSAIGGTPIEGYYFVNEDRSIWASAWWTGQEENYLYVKEDGFKEGWFRSRRSRVADHWSPSGWFIPTNESAYPLLLPNPLPSHKLILPHGGLLGGHSKG